MKTILLKHWALSADKEKLSSRNHEEKQGSLFRAQCAWVQRTGIQISHITKQDFLSPCIQPAPNLIYIIQFLSCPSFWENHSGFFLKSCWQTNTQTDGQGWKHNIPGWDNKNWFVSDTTSRSYQSSNLMMMKSWTESIFLQRPWTQVT